MLNLLEPRQNYLVSSTAMNCIHSIFDLIRFDLYLYMKIVRTDCCVVGVSSLCLHFDVMLLSVWSLHFVRIVSMMMCYYLVAFPGAVMMDMMMFDDLTIPDLSIVATVMYSIFYEKYPLWFPYCRDLSFPTQRFRIQLMSKLSKSILAMQAHKFYECFWLGCGRQGENFNKMYTKALKLTVLLLLHCRFLVCRQQSKANQSIANQITKQSKRHCQTY